MLQNLAILKSATLGVIGLFALFPGYPCGHRALAAERVQFETARYHVGQLQLRLARERGETVVRAPVDVIDGYLSKPDGVGPFPAIVHLHGCGGLPDAFKAGVDKGLWSERLASWGYVVLAVDSFTTRGIGRACSQGLAPRMADAYGGLAYLAGLPFVDANSIAVIGFSQGATATLEAVGQHDAELFDREGDRKFKAAIAFYPSCRSEGAMAAPTLILIGELDDWTRASACTTMMASRTGAGSPVRLIVYPGAHHDFDVVSLQPGREYLGHRLEYNAAAAEQATEEVRQFLAQQLR
jgi:dienelactone hydrolase